MSDFSNNYRQEFNDFSKHYPMKKAFLKGGTFRYILAGPENAKYTLVLMNGGMNSYEMWLRYVKDLSSDYRILSFDYPMMYETIQSLCAGIHELLQKLGINKAVFVGASLGALISQVYAVVYPDDVEAMALMSTAGLTQATMKKFGGFLKLLVPVRGLLKVLPYSWFIRLEKGMIKNYLKEADDESKAYFQQMFEHIYDNYTREKDIHVTSLQLDLGKQRLTSRDDYQYLSWKVLLLLPEDDSEFPKETQDELINEMTDPMVISDIHGGHLTTMLNYRQYEEFIRHFIDGLS